jgi:metal-responsive CopG/Arc/MetJ family transcriptional regulator
MHDDNQLTTLQVAVPAELVATVDELVGQQFIDREEFVREAIRRYVEHIQASKAKVAVNSERN